jgi:hypothetical protein
VVVSAVDEEPRVEWVNLESCQVAEASGYQMTVHRFNAAWYWQVRDRDHVESQGRMLGGTVTEPPPGLLQLVELIAATLAAAREVASNERTAPSAPEEDPCAE